MDEVIYNFEIHHDENEYETSISSIDIIDAIYGVMDIYKDLLNIYLTEDEFYIIGE